MASWICSLLLGRIDWITGRSTSTSFALYWSARTSFGRHDPPKAKPGFKYDEERFSLSSLQKMSMTSWLSTPTRLHRLPISLANTTLTECQVLLVYFSISATRMLVLYSGASMFWYRALVGAASAAWLWPTSVSGGCRKSLSAVPSRRNSGLTDTPKPSPYFLPEEDSSAGITLPCVVPGSTVLRTTTTW